MIGSSCSPASLCGTPCVTPPPTHSRCARPSPLDKNALTCGCSAMASPTLVTSPVTPLSVPRRERRFDALLDGEREVLRSMIIGSTRHRAKACTLLRDMAEVGSEAYLSSRSIIIEWMIDVCAGFKFQPSTLHTAVRHMDWFMSERKVHQQTWQLCAVTALFIAAKCEESGTQVPLLDDLKYVCGNAYESELVRCMEVCILDALNWDTLTRTPIHYLQFFLVVMRRRVTETNMRTHGITAMCAAKTPCASPISDNRWQSSINEPTAREDGADDDFYLNDEGDGCSDFEDNEEMSEYDDDDENGDSDYEGSDYESDECDSMSCCEMEDDTDMAGGVGNAIAYTAECVLDLSLYEPSLIARHGPRVLAVAAIVVARDACAQEPAWTDELTAVAGVTSAEITVCRSELSSIFEKARAAQGRAEAN